MTVVEDVFDGLKRRALNMQMINITQLSEYRKGGHCGSQDPHYVFGIDCF